MRNFSIGIKSSFNYFTIRKMSKILNENNILKKPKPLISRFYKQYKESVGINHKLIILRKFIDSNFDNTIASTMKIDKVIRKLDIYLSEHEMDKIFRMKEIAFAYERSFKKLDIPVKIGKRENCFFKFDKGELYDYNGNKWSIILDTGVVYVTNKSIIISGERITKIKLDKNTSITLKPFGLIIKNDVAQKKEYILKSEDDEILMISAMRIISRNG